MHISLRTMTAGTAAVVGAGAIAMTPLAPAVSAPSVAVPSAAQVSLTGLDSPLTELAATVALINNDIFNGTDLYGDYEWEPYQGLLPEFIYNALPVISQVGFNGAAYIGGSVAALTEVTTILSEAVWNLPGAVITATQQAIGGDFSGALATLTTATLVPLQNAGGTALAAGVAVLSSVITNITNVIATVPRIVGGLVTTTVGSLTAVVDAAVNIGTQTVGALSTLDLETAWNVVVDGLLGPVGADGTVASSLPGTIEAVTIGPGLGPLGNPNGYAVPSFRMWAEQSNLQIANALGATFPVPLASVAAPVAAKKAGRSAAAVRSAATVSEPAAQSAAGDSSTAGAENTTPSVRADATQAEKPTKHRASRKAADAAN